jgi:hypothetical protein
VCVRCTASAIHPYKRPILEKLLEDQRENSPDRPSLLILASSIQIAQENHSVILGFKIKRTGYSSTPATGPTQILRRLRVAYTAFLPELLSPQNITTPKIPLPKIRTHLPPGAIAVSLSLCAGDCTRRHLGRFVYPFLPSLTSIDNKATWASLLSSGKCYPPAHGLTIPVRAPSASVRQRAMTPVLSGSAGRRSVSRIAQNTKEHLARPHRVSLVRRA